MSYVKTDEIKNETKKPKCSYVWYVQRVLNS